MPPISKSFREMMELLCDLMVYKQNTLVQLFGKSLHFEKWIQSEAILLWERHGFKIKVEEGYCDGNQRRCDFVLSSSEKENSDLWIELKVLTNDTAGKGWDLADVDVQKLEGHQKNGIVLVMCLDFPDTGDRGKENDTSETIQSKWDNWFKDNEYRFPQGCATEILPNGLKIEMRYHRVINS